MKIFIDTNVLIDYLTQRAPYSTDAEKIMILCKDKWVSGCVSALSIMNIFYILRKKMIVENQKKFWLAISKYIEIVGIDRKNIINVLTDQLFTDVEDCLQAECAKMFSADYIVTRNVKDFQNSTIPAILPDEFLRIAMKIGKN